MSSGWGVPQNIFAGGGLADELRVFTENFTLTAWHVANKYMVLLKVPVAPAETELTVIGGPDQQYGVDFVITSDDGGKRLTWDGLGLDGILADGDVLQISYPIAVPP